MNGRLPFVPVAVCESIVDPARVVERIEQVYRWIAEGQVVVAKPTAMRMTHDEPNFKSHSKAVILPPLGVAGLRVVGYRIQDDGSGPSSPNSTRLVVLMDLETGEPLALLDEHYNYTLRTAASVAVAARYLAPSKPRLGIIGAGGVAQAVLRMFAEVLPLEEVLITSRRPESRQGLVDRYSGEMGFPLRAVDSSAEIFERCNVIVTATTTKSPLVTMADVRPGMLLCALGSFELEPEVYAQADKLFVDDWGQTEAAHDIAPLLKSGLFGPERLSAELAEVVTGKAPGRSSDDEIIVVRAEGLASQDIALAHWAYQEAERLGLTQGLTL